MENASLTHNQYFIESKDGTKLNVEEYGSGTPVLLLAGGPGFNAGYLEPVWNILGGKCKVIVPDQRGTGNSAVETVNEASMSLENYNNDIEALRMHLNLDKLTIIGHSWGGMLAMEYAASHSEHVRKLLLLGPGGPTANFVSYFFDNVNMRLYKSDFEEIAALSEEGKPPYQGMWPGYFFDREKGLENKSDTDFSSFYGQPEVDKFTMGDYFSSGEQRVAGLKEYKGPIHIIQGRQDPMGASTVQEIKQALPESQIYFIEKTGHYPWLENDAQKEEFFKLLFEALL